jgi:hypothetical protein
MSGTRLAQNNAAGGTSTPNLGVTNNLGTQGPAGSTSVSSALAAGGAGSNHLSNGGGGVVGGNGVIEGNRQLSGVTAERRHVAMAPKHHIRVASLSKRHVTRIAHRGRIEGRSVAQLNAREHRVTEDLNRQQLRRTTAFAQPFEGMSERQITAQLNLDQLNRVG